MPVTDAPLGTSRIAWAVANSSDMPSPVTLDSLANTFAGVSSNKERSAASRMGITQHFNLIATTGCPPSPNSLLLLGLFLKCLPDGITNEHATCLAHRLDGVVIAGVQAHGQWALAQWFLPLRDAVLMLPEVFD